ncbi:MAG: hypothetical protein LBE38_05075 [Deltaproteobacteria bacterium]|jgi:malate/lactate dehydrogenase|nr:hypothetical protein [Deltaproteobacteria bacterium]
MSESNFLYSKIAIVGGAGGLGSAMAFHVGLSKIAREIIIIDPQTNVLTTQEIDMRECFVGQTPTKIRAGEFKEASGADAVLMAASRSGAQVKSRTEYLFANLELVRHTSQNIKNFCPDATIIVATAPVDTYVMIFLDELGVSRHKVLGFCINDSQRFRWALGKALNIDPARCRGLILGEHGETQVPLFSLVEVDGKPYKLSDKEIEDSAEYVADWYTFWQSQNAGRTTTWSSAVGMLRTLKGLCGITATMPLMGSVLLEGEYGIKDVALGVPLKGKDQAWETVQELAITDAEKEKLVASGKSVADTYNRTLGK